MIQLRVNICFNILRNIRVRKWKRHLPLGYVTTVRKKGHIRPFCYKLYGFPKQLHQKIQKSKEINVKRVWKPKVVNIGLMAHISLRASFREEWYFDSGCSRHMTGFKNLLDVEKFCTNTYVTFRNGTKGKIVGTRNLISNDLPKG